MRCTVRPCVEEALIEPVIICGNYGDDGKVTIVFNLPADSVGITSIIAVSETQSGIRSGPSENNAVVSFRKPDGTETVLGVRAEENSP